MLIFLGGCDRKPLVVSFQNATMAGSDQNTLNVFFADDKKFEDKYFDIWLKSDTENLEITINKSNQLAHEIKVEKSDNWYSLTSLEHISKNQTGQEDYSGYKDAIDITYIIRSAKECKLTFKAVTGDKIKNADETGFMLINAEDVSKEYTQKITPLKNE